MTLTNVGALAIGLVIGGNVGELARQGGGLLDLKFNRDDERGRRSHRHGDRRPCRRYRPGGWASPLWQKMGQVAGGAPPPLAVDAPIERGTVLKRIRGATKDVA